MNKYQLHIGCHRYTITSRDSIVEYYDTEEFAEQAYMDHKKFYNRIGYVVWFAKIKRPDGTEKMLEENSFYENP